MQISMTRRSFLGVAAGLGSLCALAGCAQNQQSTSNAADAGNAKSQLDAGSLSQPLDNGYSSGIHHAVMEVTGFGTIKLELNATNAPITVSNFADLADGGFYDGLTFHRIIKGFMVQGGDPEGTGKGGSGRAIKGEFSANGVVNAIQHKRGTISMARSSDYNSASSQFFIMQEDNASLDGQYAAFGRVSDGLEVVDALAGVSVQDSNGTVAPEDQPVISSIRMVD